MLGLVAEAHALAVELNAISHLGLARRIKLDAVIKDTWGNGMSGAALPYRTFTSIIKGMRKDTKEQGVVAAIALCRVLKWKRHVKAYRR